MRLSECVGQGSRQARIKEAKSAVPGPADQRSELVVPAN